MLKARREDELTGGSEVGIIHRQEASHIDKYPEDLKGTGRKRVRRGKTENR